MTFVIPGIAEKSEFTTTFRPSFLLTILRGLKALNTRRAFNDFKCFAEETPRITVKYISVKEAITTKKSRRFHQLKMYPLILGILLVKKPRVIIFKVASKANNKVNIKILQEFHKICIMI